MTREQIQRIDYLRDNGHGYRTISNELGLPVNTVKSWCGRHPLDGSKASKCLFCNQPVNQTPGKRKKKFCSSACRFHWWNKHPEARNPKKLYSHLCAFCGNEFMSMRANTRYCSRDCFSLSRKKGKDHG